MNEFEEDYEKLQSPLYVLPPASPKKNGGVERGNKTFREEFYERSKLLADSLGSMRYDLKLALIKYNTYRPHWGLKRSSIRSIKGLIPKEYIQKSLKEAA